LTIGIIDNFQSELNRSRDAIANRRSQIINVFPPSLKHCVCFVDRKNYRLQDIQLSKISRRSFAPPGPPRLARLRGPLRPRAAREARSLFARALESLSRRTRRTRQTVES